jgi:hypothetical protein
MDVANNKQGLQKHGKNGREVITYMTWSLLAGGGEYPVQDGFSWSNGVEIDDREIVLSSW